jgi:hypothetical protein
VETDYVSSTALFTGHATARSAFDATLTYCYYPGVAAALAQDRAGFLLLGDVNKPGVMDSPCLLAYASSSSSAVRLLHTTRDDASAFELIGPGTGHPGVEELTSGLAPQTSVAGSSATVEWDWGALRPVSQVSVGEAELVMGSTTSVRVDLREADGRWVTVASAGRPAGDGAGFAPYLLATLPTGTTAGALRVVATGTSRGAALSVDDVHALGPTASP